MEELSLDSTEGQFEHLRQLIIFGKSNADHHQRTIIRRPTESPWDVYLPPKPWRGQTARVQWIDEFMEAARQNRLAVVREVAVRALTPPKLSDMPATVRWRCAKPTDRPALVLDQGLYAAPMPEMVPGFGDLVRRWLEKR